ncbi:hypothetical protein SLOPH_811, partial [Spraguea lophii 42_110]
MKEKEEDTSLEIYVLIKYLGSKYTVDSILSIIEQDENIINKFVVHHKKIFQYLEEQMVEEINVFSTEIEKYNEDRLKINSGVNILNKQDESIEESGNDENIKSILRPPKTKNESYKTVTLLLNLLTTKDKNILKMMLRNNFLEILCKKIYTNINRNIEVIVELLTTTYQLLVLEQKEIFLNKLYNLGFFHLITSKIEPGVISFFEEIFKYVDINTERLNNEKDNNKDFKEYNTPYEIRRKQFDREIEYKPKKLMKLKANINHYTVEFKVHKKIYNFLRENNLLYFINNDYNVLMDRLIYYHFKSISESKNDGLHIDNTQTYTLGNSLSNNTFDMLLSAIFNNVNTNVLNILILLLESTTDRILIRRILSKFDLFYFIADLKDIFIVEKIKILRRYHTLLQNIRTDDNILDITVFYNYLEKDKIIRSTLEVIKIEDKYLSSSCCKIKHTETQSSNNQQSTFSLTDFTLPKTINEDSNIIESLVQNNEESNITHTVPNSNIIEYELDNIKENKFNCVLAHSFSLDGLILFSNLFMNGQKEMMYRISYLILIRELDRKLKIHKCIKEDRELSCYSLKSVGYFFEYYYQNFVEYLQRNTYNISKILFFKTNKTEKDIPNGIEDNKENIKNKRKNVYDTNEELESNEDSEEEIIVKRKHNINKDSIIEDVSSLYKNTQEENINNNSNIQNENIKDSLNEEDILIDDKK